MARTIVVCAILLAHPFAVLADKPAAPTETVVRLTVQPMPAPKPALKYQLLPELPEMQPGNPIQGFLRCFSEQHNFFYNREAVMKREEYQKMPLASLPTKELKNYGKTALDQADYAARLDTPDWQMIGKMRKEGYRLLLPDLQGMRDLTRALKVRFRVAVAQKRFHEGIRTAKTMFALSRLLGKHPTLIGNLVGMAVANETIGPLEEMLQQPGCPNLYWALTEMPSPLVELSHGIQGERLMGTTDLSFLKENEPMSPQQLDNAVKWIEDMYDAMQLKYGLSAFLREKDPQSPRLSESAVKWVGDMRGLMNVNFEDDDKDGKLTPREWLKKMAKDEARLRAARRRLVESGLAAKSVEAFPAMQVILLDEKREYEDRRDEQTKGMLLPYWQGEAVLFKTRVPSKGDALLRPMLPLCGRIRNAQVRVDRRIALLRCVEALRLYAAAHDGKLPENLADIAVPLPIDPITGKPFTYKKEGTNATLHGTPPRGEEKNPSFNLRYEVTIKS